MSKSGLEPTQGPGFPPSTRSFVPPLNLWSVPPNYPLYYTSSLGPPATFQQFSNPLSCAHNFTAQAPVVLPLAPKDVSVNDPSSVAPIANSPVNGKSAIASALSNIITNIKEWVVVDIEENGAFRIAGHNVETGQLHSSEKIIFINNRGNLVSDGKQTFILLGPIAWGLYEVQFPDVEVNPSPDLRLAFSDGFPEKNRKKWITVLFDFLKYVSIQGSGNRNKGNDGIGTVAPRKSVITYPSQLDDSFSAPLSVINRKPNHHRRRQPHDVSIFEEDDPIPSLTMLEEECFNDTYDGRASGCGPRQRPNTVDVGVQTPLQKSSTTVKMVNASTSTRNYKELSPLSDWMRRGCRLDIALRKAYRKTCEVDKYPQNDESSEGRLIVDIDGETESSNRSPREKSSNPRPQSSPSIFKPLHKAMNNRRQQIPVRIIAKKKFSSGRKSALAVSESTSSSSSKSCLVKSLGDSFLKETFPDYRRLEIKKQNQICSRIDDRHKLFTQNGIVDVRDLKRTRSGRLSIPTRETLHRQKIVFNGNDVSVDHGEYGKYFSSMIND